MAKVFLDAGHGGRDPGAGGNGIQEKNITLPVTLKIGDILRNHAIDVGYSRTTDIFVELEDRASLANNFVADIFVSIHCNAATNTSAKGVETYSYPSSDYGTALAKCIQDSILLDKSIYNANRGIKKANFAVLRLTKMPAALVETAFITNAQDANILKNRQDELALTIAKGILKNLGVKYVEKGESAVNPLSKYYEKYGLKIIETAPDNVYVATLSGKTLRQFGIYGINGTWQNNSEANLPRSIWGLAGNGNKAIGPNSYQNSPKGYKRGTIIYYEDGSIEVKRINNIKEIDKSFKWCIGGGMLIPDYNPTLEKIPDDILRTTSHTGMGYKGDRVYLFVHPKCSMYEFKNCVEKLNLDGAIFLDGGGSTQMNYAGGKGIHSSRKLSHGVFLKKA
jgi:N-acetylmuramoyl-L-alanine amidase